MKMITVFLIGLIVNTGLLIIILIDLVNIPIEMLMVLETGLFLFFSYLIGRELVRGTITSKTTSVKWPR